MDYGINHEMRLRGMNAAEYLGVAIEWDDEDPEEQPASPGHDWKFWGPFWIAGALSMTMIVVGMAIITAFYPTADTVNGPYLAAVYGSAQ